MFVGSVPAELRPAPGWSGVPQLHKRRTTALPRFAASIEARPVIARPLAAAPAHVAEPPL